jgi:hypothetical protein
MRAEAAVFCVYFYPREVLGLRSRNKLVNLVRKFFSPLDTAIERRGSSGFLNSRAKENGKNGE